jgi:hypothetical protein
LGRRACLAASGFQPQTAILAQLVFLIVAAMLLIHVVEVKFAERDLIQARSRTGRLLIGALEQNLGNLFAGEREGVRTAVLEPRFRASVAKLLAEGEFSSLTLVDLKGEPIFSVSPSEGMEEEGVRFARESLKTGMESSRLTGTAWGVIWLSPKDVILSAPLSFETRPFAPCPPGVSHPSMRSCDDPRNSFALHPAGYLHPHDRGLCSL